MPLKNFSINFNVSYYGDDDDDDDDGNGDSGSLVGICCCNIGIT